jgi:predicted glycosyl hydrolase (DUF1957 family)
MTITLEEIRASLPANMKKAADQELVDTLNAIAGDPDVAQQVRENFVSYTGVLKDGKFTTEQYLAAVKYVSYKLMGDTNRDAWCKTFPHRYARLKAQGTTEKDVAAHVTMFNKGKLVNAILEQSMVPTYVLNAHLFQDALNVQADLMRSANSEKVRSDAANSILTHLKRPEAVKGQLDVTINDNSGMNELKNLLGDLAAQQMKSLEAGMPIRQITATPLIENTPLENQE